MVDLEGNIDIVKENINNALIKSNREGEEVILVAVSKTVDEETIEEVSKLGITDFGENRVQEFEKKYENMDDEINWHLIGHLQSNKAKDIIGKVVLVHSLDRMSLAKELNRRGKAANIKTDALIQVNISEEESKFGLKREETIEFIKKIKDFEYINIKGLMTIAPHVEDEDILRECFRGLRELKEEIEKENLEGVEMKYLSMGMTNDYEIAIEEGANIVRVGRAIFGERNY